VVRELDLAHSFVAGHALADPRHQLVRRGRSAQHDEGLGDFPGQRVALADDRHVRHGRVGQQESLELGRRHLVRLYLISSLTWSVTQNQPSSSAVPMSPVCSHPSASICGVRVASASRAIVSSPKLRPIRGVISSLNSDDELRSDRKCRH
jgi:hypothetical protein